MTKYKQKRKGVLNMELEIRTQEQFDEALENGLFDKATYVVLMNLPEVTSIPAMPKATYVRLESLPKVTVIPDFLEATYVVLMNLPNITAIPDLPSAKNVWLDGKKIK